jgi:putative transposase
MPRTKRPAPPPDTIWEIPESLWPVLDDILADFYPPARTGRPRVDFRVVLNGIIYRLRSSVQWNKLPREFGSDSTVHRWFQRFVADGVFEHLWAVLVEACDELGGVSWRWQAADTVLGKARSGGTSSAGTRRIAGSRAPSGAC